MCIFPLGENGLEKYRLSKKWEQFEIVLLFMDHPVGGTDPRSSMQQLCSPICPCHVMITGPYKSCTLGPGGAVCSELKPARHLSPLKLSFSRR